jgi:hypothetical protein
MGCCGNKRKPFRTNGKVCPRCGWVMNKVNKYDTTTRSATRYWFCSNKTLFKNKAGGGSCAYKETIK